MTVVYVSGDILEAKTEAVVNPVNCVGNMGAGLAYDFGEKYPDMLKDYRDLCRRQMLQPGHLHIYERHSFSPPFYIINFPTKTHWRNPSKLEYIELGLHVLKNSLEKAKIKSVSIPKLGCGLGGLNWKNVNSLLKKYLQGLDIDVHIYGQNV